MQESIFSPTWYRIAGQRPRLRAEVRVHRQHVRGERWYVLANETNGRQLRINDKAYELIGRCDGTRSLQSVWDTLVETLGDEAPTQEETIRTLRALDACDLLAYENGTDAQTLVERRDERRRARLKQLVNPFALRIPLGDPTRLLARFDGIAPFLFNPLALSAWIAVVVIAAAIVAVHGPALIAHASQYMMTPRYLVIASLAFPVLKTLHEAAHALAVRRWGGTVREAGFSLFVLVPAPYVDASAATAFAARYQRVIVSAAGMMAELAVAAFALVIWANVQPGLVQDVAFVVSFIASVSTVAFNANPLLQFDGYYVFCDLLHLPNLAARSKALWSWHALSAFARLHVPAMKNAPGELKYLIAYAPSSFAYRVFVAYVLVVWVGRHFAAIGALAAALFATTLIAKPCWSALGALRSHVGNHGARARAALLVTATGIALALLLGVVPFPMHTLAMGVVIAPEQAAVRPGTDGFVSRLLARDGDFVIEGEVVMILDDPLLFTERERLASRVERLQAARFAALAESAEAARRADEEIAAAQDALRHVDQKIEALEVRARVEGKLAMPHQQDLPGTYVRRGTAIAHVIERRPLQIRAVIPEFESSFVKAHTRRIEAVVAGTREGQPAQLLRDAPAAGRELPSPALGERGGGPHATDPEDRNGTRTQQPVVLLDVEVPTRELERVGARAWVRFDHDPAPLAGRWYRALRQVFLQNFNPAG